MQIDATVDRIEGDRAVLEIGGQAVDWPLSALPEGVAEGDRLRFAIAPVDPPSMDEARARLERLRAKGPPGDVIDL